MRFGESVCAVQSLLDFMVSYADGKTALASAWVPPPPRAHEGEFAFGLFRSHLRFIAAPAASLSKMITKVSFSMAKSAKVFELYETTQRRVCIANAPLCFGVFIYSRKLSAKAVASLSQRSL